ncbi:hypothetical protein [Rossellomorea vietnamensis]|uniref:hypothetical protein n=1 Tax=Rossellomorea vietnamensis TaxID=218284 RepID=UPI003D2650CD
MHKVYLIDADNRKVLREEIVEADNEIPEMAESFSKIKGNEILIFDGLFRTLRVEFSHYDSVSKGATTLYFLNFKNVALNDIQIPVQLEP